MTNDVIVVQQLASKVAKSSVQMLVRMNIPPERILDALFGESEKGPQKGSQFWRQSRARIGNTWTPTERKSLPLYLSPGPPLHNSASQQPQPERPLALPVIPRSC